MTYAITGASGTLGRIASELLLSKVDPAEVILISRSPDSLSELAERGAQVRAGDFDDPSSLESAFAGVDRLLLISAGDVLVDRAAQHLRAVEAAKSAGVGFIAYTSIPNPYDDSPVFVNESHLATEKAIEASGIDYSILRNSLYSDMKLPEAQGAIAAGKYFNNMGDGKAAYVSRHDCAAAAVAVLTDPSLNEHFYDITGPELLSATDLAKIFSELGGTKVESVSIDDDAAIAGMVEHGLPAELAPIFVTFGQGIRGGHLDQLSTAVKDLTGTEPQSVLEVLAGDREQLTAA